MNLELRKADRSSDWIKLNDVLQDEIDFARQSTILVADINKQTADKYERDTLKRLGY